MFQVNDDYHENLTLEKVDALLEAHAVSASTRRRS